MGRGGTTVGLGYGMLVLEDKDRKLQGVVCKTHIGRMVAAAQ